MSGVSKKLMGTTAAGGGFTAIEDVFSTYLYTGNGSTQTITNGIDLAGEGGLVWFKDRTLAANNRVFDTERGYQFSLITNGTGAQSNHGSTGLTGFNSDGFGLGSAVANASGSNYASWTFRKAPRFFDVVTYTGNTGNRTIPHSLDSEVGMIILKKTSGSGDWYSYHNSLGNTKAIALNSTGAAISPVSFWQSTTPTSSEFYVNSDWNDPGQTYVAYLFAHDPLGPSGDGSDGLIACGSFTGNSLGTRQEINLGWEPQWLLIKRVDGAGGNWRLYDTMRGWSTAGTWNQLAPNLSDAEAVQGTTSEILPNGFTVSFSTSEYIYIAIRRGPMRAPESGTEVFAPNFYGTSGYIGYLGAPADMSMLGYRNGNSQNAVVRTRMLPNTKGLVTSSTAAEVTTNSSWDNMSGVSPVGTTLSTLISWTWKRAPGFFDVVAYIGNDTYNRALEHNLTVSPEMIVLKARNRVDNWPVYHTGIGTGKSIYLNRNNPSSLDGSFPTAPTDSVFYLGAGFQDNGSTYNYIAYLFATLAGVSKVGSYTGNGSSQTINCGFTTGARFILIKRTDSTGDWYVWDTARGIVTGNDPHLSLNTTAAEVTTDDSIDPDSSGFIVNQVAATNINVSAASYIFYAVA